MMRLLLLMLTACGGKASFDPVADAGPDQIVAVGGVVTLDGSGSADPDGSVEFWTWDFIERPQGSAAELSATDATATFTADVAGVYIVGLRVSDDMNNLSAVDVVNVQAGSLGEDLPPVAELRLVYEGVPTVGVPVTLDGSLSADPEGAALTWGFEVLLAPAGSTASIDYIGDGPIASFTPDLDGEYRLALVVNDGVNASLPDEEVLNVGVTGNLPPVAACEGPAQALLGEIVTLDGSGSTDPEGAPLSYSWFFDAKPEGSGAALDLPDSPTPSFMPDLEGSYAFSLVVSDGVLQSEPCVVVVEGVLELNNGAPIADAGPDMNAEPNSSVTLDASGSSDPDDDPLSFSWTFISLPTGSALDDSDLVGADTVAVTFSPDVEGSYTLQVTACDWEPLCDSDEVVVTVGVGLNNPPVSVAGDDQSVASGDTVFLDGTGSYDPDGDPITYRWAFNSVPTTSALVSKNITDRLTDSASFVPDVDGNYELKLVVNDGTVDAKDYMIVTVGGTGINTPPVADAGADQTATLGGGVVLDGSGSYDPDGDPITYRWAFYSVPSGSTLVNGDIADRMTVSGSFVPDVEGVYELKLVVSDPYDSSPKDLVTITVSGSGTNNPPVADAGTDFSVAMGDTATADGSASYDPDGDPITYLWGFRSVATGSALTNASMSGRSTATPSFTPDVEGSYELRLTVSDGTSSVKDYVIVTAGSGGGTNNPPVADAGPDSGGCTLELVTLDGSGSSDPDGDTITYSWSFSSVPSGSAITNSSLSSRTSVSPTFTPDVMGTYTLKLTVSDGTDSATDTVSVVFDDQGAALVLHLDEGSGKTLGDSSTNGNDGTGLIGTWTGARFFGGYSFDGSEMATIPHDSSLALTSDWTVEFWMRSDGAASTGYEMVFFKGPTNEYALYRYSTNTLYFYGRTSTGYATLNVTKAHFDGDWHHYAVTWTSGHVITLYEDGTSLGTFTARGPLVTGTDPLYLGNHPSYTTYYALHASLDEFIVLDHALTATEVADRAASDTQFCTEAQDTDAPLVSISSPSSGSASASVVKVEGTASDDSAIVSVTVNGSEAVATSDNYGTWVAYVSLSEGSNTLSVTAEDIAGNISSSGSSVTVTWADTCYDAYALSLPFDEDSGGGATDATGNGLDATETGTERVVGVYGNAVVFDGSASASVPDDGSLSLSSAFTIDLWYARDGSTTDYEFIAYKGDASTYNYAVVAYQGYIGCGLQDVSGADVAVYASGFNDGDFHHLACTFNGSTLSLYVDGNLENSASSAGSAATNTSDLLLGSLSGLYNFTGYLDGLNIQGTALSASEVAALYTDGELCAISENLAPLGTATASAMASVNYDGSKVIDEDTSEDAYADQTYWLLPASRTGYVTVDLGATVGITRLRWANTHHGPRYTAAAKAYTILVSDTGQFAGEEVEVDSGTGSLETDLRFHQVDLSTPVVGRYVRFTVDSFHSSAGGINELQVFGLE